MLIIGDVHGKVNAYKKIVEGYSEETIQVGDFGFSKEHIWHLKNIDNTKHKINFGNHDDMTFVNHDHSLKDGTLVEFNNAKLMTVRGARTPDFDKAYRIPNVDWWENEELTVEEISEIAVLYYEKKPKIMVTHDCPSSVREQLFGIPNTEGNKSITTSGLEIMFALHQPELWIFGHHHRSKDEVINGTRFICLAELETFEI